MKFSSLKVKDKILLYILPTIVISIIASACLGYGYAKQIFTMEYKNQKELVASNVINAVKLIDAGYRMLEKNVEDDMETGIQEFKNEFEKAGGDPEKVPLDELKSKMGGKYDLLIIDSTATIIKSTVPEGMGFNFIQFDKVVGEEINKIRLSNKVRHERIRTNVGTGLLSKFAYIPTSDHKYLLEISYSEGGLRSSVSDLEPLKITTQLVHTSPIVTSIRIFDTYGYEFVDSGTNYKPTQESLKIVERAKKEKRFEVNEANQSKSYIFIDLQANNPSMSDNSKIIEIVYNNSGFMRTIQHIATIISFVGCILILLFVFIILILSKRITYPITLLATAAKSVAEGDYSVSAKKISRDEIGDLTDVFNTMLTKIKENFEKIASQKTELEDYNKNLEKKVDERTNELFLAKETIKKEKYVLESILDDTLSGYWDWDFTQQKQYFSPGYKKMLGYHDEELSNTNDTFIKLIFPEDFVKVKESLIKHVQSKGKVPFHTEARFTHKAGSTIWTIITGHVIEWSDDNMPMQMVGCLININEIKIRQEEVEYLNFHDQLTDLYNRRFFEKELTRLDTEQNLPLTLVMFDVNGLKLINDAFGHTTGDKVLQKTAEIMKAECRSDDIVARFGGDEFIFLLPRTSSEEANDIVKKIHARLEKGVLDTISISVSHGWSTKENASTGITEVFKIAEDFMYRHKLSESRSMHYKTVEIIIKTLHEKSEREKKHSERVAQLSEAIGIALGLGQEDIGNLRVTGLMHDIGKIAIDLSILDKPSPLNDLERAEVERHPELGYQILRSINEFARLSEYVLAHHERWDGEGYPRRLKGLQIPLEARIIAIADAYDAMTSDRAYRNALDSKAAIQEILSHAGTQFDPEIAKVFVKHVFSERESAVRHSTGIPK